MWELFVCIYCSLSHWLAGNNLLIVITLRYIQTYCCHISQNAPNGTYVVCSICNHLYVPRREATSSWTSNLLCSLEWRKYDDLIFLFYLSLCTALYCRCVLPLWMPTNLPAGILYSLKKKKSYTFVYLSIFLLIYLIY